MNGDLGRAAGLGAVSGLRSLTGAAVVAHELAGRGGLRRRRIRRRGRPLERWLSRTTVARPLELLALGELIADKLPGLPARIAPGPLVARAVIGGVLGSLAAGREWRVGGPLIGAGSAVAAAFVGWWVRREAARATHLPDGALAAAEDALALALAGRVAARL